VILYRLTDQRVAEITFLDHDVHPLEHLLS